MSKGLFIVFEGIDGSGKTTQIDLLAKYLSDRNIPFEIISFPQYGKNEYARQIKDYLDGKLGKIKEIDPYFVAKLYVSDRLTAKDLIKSWLMDGKLVIANRFVSSSKAHLGANLPHEKRVEFIRWIDQLEYETNRLPKPDLTILLNVDPNVGQENALKDHKVDIHEKSIEHERQASKIYLELSRTEENWVVLDCMGNDQMRGKEEIFDEIIRILKDKLPFSL